MSSLETREERVATLKMSHAADGQFLAARVPIGTTAEEFGRLAGRAFEVISKLTNHPCLSGRIKFVVEDSFLNDVIRVNLNSGHIM